ncbi:EAL domain-containing protein [Ferrimonas balearica]|uniref:EAL domain-containing protein n=1 Tax=Ferrimonas balearica TaxID=44012 RepID=UPI001C99FF07|nr:EAL domain-containing protein [Ferrimonas balearica]MBY5922637.1 EAL domain-containing protein [Ferrimonas balearica]MBY5995621.1 EAL domain-containing protein [Ferrimonas balearica]
MASHYKTAASLQSILFRVSELASHSPTMERFYQELAPLVQQFPGTANCYVALFDPITERFDFPFFLDERDSSPHVDTRYLLAGCTGYVYRHGKPLNADNATLARLVEQGEVQRLGHPAEAWLGVPLKQEETVIGVLVLQSYQPGFRYTQAQLEFLTFVGQHLITAMERLKLRAQTERLIEHRTRALSRANKALQQEVAQRRRAERLQNALLEITEITASGRDIDSFYRAIHSVLRHLLYAENCFVALLDAEGEHLTFPYFEVGDALEAPPPRKPGDGLTEQVMAAQRPLRLCRDTIDSRYRDGSLGQSVDRCLIDLRDWMGAPLVINGEIRGVLAVFSQHPDYGYEDKDLDVLGFVSQHISTAIERRQALEQRARYREELERKVTERTREVHAMNVDLHRQILQRRKAESQLRHDALHDTLTGLPNRALLLSRMDQALKHIKRHPDERFALLFIDLDRFKLVNDSLGHLAGDTLLETVAQRLSRCVRDNDTLARLGGDEFVILLDGIRNRQHVQEAAERLLEQLRQPLKLEGKEFFPGASIGIALADPHQNASPQTLLRDADAALYHAKSAGRGGFQFFDQQMHAEAVADLTREAQFRQALNQGQITVHYQPVMDLEQQQVVGMEALARWHHPQLGELTPDQFLPQACHSGAVAELDCYVLRQVCRDYPQLRQQIGHRGWVHVNLDLTHLRSNSKLEKLERCIESLTLPKGQLALEFSERDLMVDQPTLHEGLNRLQCLGVKLGLDDVGTGYSALAMLPLLPLDFVKVDKHYSQKSTDCERHRAVLQSLVALSGQLGFVVSAEGIEQPGQHQLLKGLGCRWGQGYLFRAPEALPTSAELSRSG